eukprot:TRINITY_DN4027_c0_g1_i1.p1 TRINITY_DN4027_c0_g1~~TRINITY_DN4027_c0_g1_i1.p1  ORF type:complete len:536 (-),score=126.04 TRINITY_DN4027_c0_g1_i1:26-1633(-)
MRSINSFNLVPKPVKFELSGEGEFNLSGSTVLVYSNEESKQVANFLSQQISERIGMQLNFSDAQKESNVINFVLESSAQDQSSLQYKEGYSLQITSNSIQIKANKPAGLFYGVQTLLQLLLSSDFLSTPTSTSQPSSLKLPSLNILDYPRFSWRGIHLDVCRHFFPKSFLFRYLSLLAFHKFNTFHLHLTEDQGWRFQSLKHPNLTTIGSTRSSTLIGPGGGSTFDNVTVEGFYSQDDLRELVSFAATLFINIVPEIEMPGHAQAAIAAYPELGNTDIPDRSTTVWNAWGVNPNVFNVEQTTIQFLQDILDEVLAIFPSKYIHIGGDEAPKDQWKASALAQKRMKELGCKDEDELQSWFIKTMDKYLTSKGRVLIGWDEILEGGLAEGAVVMSWRGDEGGIAAAKAKHDVVMTPGYALYFDHYQGDPKTEPLAIRSEILDVKQVWNYWPVPKELVGEEKNRVLGAQGQVWTEYMKTGSHVEYMLYPRACALSEVVWTGESRSEDGGYEGFSQRLEGHLQRLSTLGVNYRRDFQKH